MQNYTYRSNIDTRSVRIQTRQQASDLLSMRDKIDVRRTKSGSAGTTNLTELRCILAKTEHIVCSRSSAQFGYRSDRERL